MIALAGVAGGLFVAGLVLLALELTRRGSAPGTPPRRRVRISRITRNRALLALAAGGVTLAVTGWPVAMIAAALAAVFLPAIISTRAPMQRAAVLEGLEQWTRRRRVRAAPGCE